MSGTYLLDTNAAIALLNLDNVVQMMVGEADEIFVPSIVIGELYYGAEKSGRVEANLNKVDEFTLRYVVLVCDVDTAYQYGRIRHQLRVKGQPIPENDIWIAAIARQHDLTLLTRDSHFQAVDDLELHDWKYK